MRYFFSSTDYKCLDLESKLLTFYFFEFFVDVGVRFNLFSSFMDLNLLFVFNNFRIIFPWGRSIWLCYKYFPLILSETWISNLPEPWLIIIAHIRAIRSLGKEPFLPRKRKWLFCCWSVQNGLDYLFSGFFYERTKSRHAPFLLIIIINFAQI